MAELNEIPAMPAATIADEDLLLVYDVSAGRAYRISRAAFLTGVARTSGLAEFEDLSAEEATFTTVTAGMARFVSGPGIADIAAVTVTVPALAAGATGTVVATVPNAVVGMAVKIAPAAALPAGLIANAHVNAPGQITITFANGSSTAITAIAKTFSVTLISLS